MAIIMICLLLMLAIQAESFDKYENILKDLESFLEWEGTEYFTLGYTIENNPIKALKINSNSDLNCVVVGGIHANEQASVLQVMTLIQHSLRQRSSINANIWFVPILNVDGYLKIEDYYRSNNKTLEIKNNQRDTGCSSLIHKGVDLNRNFESGKVGKCQNEYQGTAPFSEPETVALLQLLDSYKFQLIMAYFSGDLKYVVPSPYFSNKVFSVVQESMPGSLVNYGNANGIFSVAGYVSHASNDFSFIDRNVPIFFEFFSRIGLGITLSSKKEFVGNDGALWIYIENKGLNSTQKNKLIIESDHYLHGISVLFDNSNHESYMRGQRKTLILNLDQIQPFESIKVRVKFVAEFPDINFSISVKKDEFDRVKSLGWIGGFSIFAAYCFVSIVFLLVYCYRRNCTSSVKIHMPFKHFQLKRLS